MKIYLCGEKGCCPSVDVGNDMVTIGEEGNKCQLSMNEWNELKQKIISGEI